MAPKPDSSDMDEEDWRLRNYEILERDYSSLMWLQLVLTAAYTAVFACSYSRYRAQLKTQMKVVIIAFYLLMVLNSIYMVGFEKFRKHDTVNDREIMTVQINYSLQMQVVNIYILLMYQVLFMLKRVELQINPKYSTAGEILTNLRK